MRRAVKTDLALSRKTQDQQIDLLMPDKDVQACEYADLVTSDTYALQMFGQKYRDRAVCFYLPTALPWLQSKQLEAQV